ncbi:MAG: hypothetical protein R3F37_13395 [Candidatus Competibacteraceae bacterium]
MGWANGAYTEDTQFMLDDFTISTESLEAGSVQNILPPDNLRDTVNRRYWKVKALE